jgi:hypothetical protein
MSSARSVGDGARRSYPKPSIYSPPPAVASAPPADAELSQLTREFDSAWGNAFAAAAAGDTAVDDSQDGQLQTAPQWSSDLVKKVDEYAERAVRRAHQNAKQRRQPTRYQVQRERGGGGRPESTGLRKKVVV